MTVEYLRFRSLTERVQCQMTDHPNTQSLSQDGLLL